MSRNLVSNASLRDLCVLVRGVALIALLLPLQASPSDAASAVDGLTRMQRDICHSFKLDCRKGRTAPAQRQKPAAASPPRVSAKPAPPAAKVPTPAAKPLPPAKTAETLPLPREKPATRPAAKPVAEAQPAPAVSPEPEIPVPRKKPKPPPAETVAKAVPATNLVVPIARERPALLPSLPPVARATVATPAEPSTDDAQPPKPDSKVASIAPQPAIGPTDCEQSLRNGKVQFDAVPASFGAATCPVADPVRLHSVETPSGTVSFPEGPVFNCRFARQFAQWVSDTGSAVVLAQTSKRLEKLATGPGYDCRRRNGDSTAKMSEHAAGDAVDITSMTLDGGTTIHMADAINPAAASYPVLRALRTTACGYFTTVLGPGANAAHKEHFHFDLGVHGKSASYRICE